MTTRGRGTGGRFWRRRDCWVPTWRTWLIGALALIASVAALVLGAYPFLAVSEPIGAQLLVVEGWCDDFVLEAALEEFGRGGHARILVTGGPLEQGAPLSEYGTYAELGAATLRRLAGPDLPIAAVPAPGVVRDRTYGTAVALRRWLQAQGPLPAAIDLVTVAHHARRSRLLFQMALGESTPVGILAVPDPEYDHRRWWTSSAGVRAVIGELIAYAYAATLFRPPPAADLPRLMPTGGASRPVPAEGR